MADIAFRLIIQKIKRIDIYVMNFSSDCWSMMVLITHCLFQFMLQQLIIAGYSLMPVSEIKFTICSFVTKIKTTKTVAIEEILIPESWLSSWCKLPSHSVLYTFFMFSCLQIDVTCFSFVGDCRFGKLQLFATLKVYHFSYAFIL